MKTNYMVYMFVAYAFIWALIFFYTLLIGNRQKKVAEELELLKQSLKDRL